MFEREHERVNALLQGALERPPEERERWLAQACGSNAALRARVTELLYAVHQETESPHPPTPPRAGGSGSDPKRTRGSSAPEGSGGAVTSGPRLVAGQQLGRYQILDLLGAGGMGTVYRALDPSLGREVAIKALGHAFRGDSGSLRRFEREARVLAALSHPNIASIYGFERLDGAPYLVLERVDGDTLAQRLTRGPIAWREASAIATQIIDGLEEAHRKGVIHRDLKPSNVMLTPNGRAKLVDFGLAKTAATPYELDTEASVAITAAGAVLGTARYMSPEQVRGEEVDTRTDVWAFGCVLYEMLTGRAGFPGRSVPEVLAAVLRDEPDWKALPDEVPVPIQRLLRRCLRRDTQTRLQHIGDARLDLLDAETEAQAVGHRRASFRATRAMRWILALGSLAIVAAVVALVVMSWPERPLPPRPLRLSLELPAQIVLGKEYPAPFALSPDGSRLALEAVEGSSQRRLYIRGLDDLSLRLLPGTEDAWQPVFSPDGAWVAYFADRKLVKMQVSGGPALALAEIGGNPRGATWSQDGTIILSATQTSGLTRISERGGRPAVLTTLDRARGEYSHRWPDALPGGKWVLFTAALEDASFDDARIEAVSTETGERRVVVNNAGFARYLPTRGQLLFVRSGRVYAVGFDLDRMAIHGSPEVVLDGVRYDPRNGGCHLAVSASGMLIYGPGVPSSLEHYLAWLDRDGTLRRVMDTPRPFRDPRVSPDGRQIAVAVGSATESDLWVVDATNTFSQLSFGLAPHRPTWTPDGRRITVGAARNETWRLLSFAADGSGTPITLFESRNRMYPDSWSPDGRQLVFQENNPETGWDLRVLTVDAEGKPSGPPRSLAATPFHEASGAISLDGKWIAYESDEVDGIVQIYVRSFPDGGNKVRVSTGGARWPVWDHRDNIFMWHTGPNQLEVAHTQRDGERLTVTGVDSVWNPNALPSSMPRVVITVAGARYDAHSTNAGTNFLVLENAGTGVKPSLTSPVLVLDWTTGPRSR